MPDEPTFGSEIEGLLDNEQPGGAEPSGEGQPQSPDGQQSPESGQQPIFNGEEWQLKYRGAPYTPKTRDELVGLAQRGFSYNQELERFNRDRAGFETKIKDLEGRMKKYSDFDEILEKNPALADQVVNMFQQVQSGGGTGQPGTQGGMDLRVVNDLMNRIQSLETTSTEYQNQRYDQQLEQSISELKGKYKDYDWDTDEGIGNLEKQVLQFALDNGITNLDHAFKAMMWDNNNTAAKAKVLKGAADARQQANRSGVINSGSGGGGGQPPPAYKHGDSYNDLARRMATEMK